MDWQIDKVDDSYIENRRKGGDIEYYTSIQSLIFAVLTLWVLLKFWLDNSKIVVSKLFIQQN